MAKAELIPLTFKDVWEAEGTETSVVAHFQSLQIGDHPLSRYFSIQTGKRLPEMEEFFGAILEHAPNKVLSIAFLGLCGVACKQSKGSKKRKYDDHRRFNDMMTPSGFGRNENWKCVQAEPAKRIMCSRPHGASLINIRLMHPIFQEIVDVLERGDPTRQDYELAARLACVQPNSYENEGRRRDDVNDLLNEYVAKAHNLVISARIVARTSESDGSAGAFFNAAYKNEKGLGTADPYMENAAYYALYWSYKDGPDYHCCPWLMMEVVGQEVGLSGGAWACGYPCVQPLSSNVPFLAVPQDRNLQQMQVRMCMALRIGFSGLAAWYRDIVPTLLTPDPQAQFPYARTFTDLNGTKIGLRYEGKMEHQVNNNALFRATRLDSNEDVVVKFTPWYGESVHELLAEHDMAPPLFACEHVAGMKMVVMGYCTGSMWPDSPSKAHMELVKRAESLLGEANLVHGDLRKPNILVEGEKIRIIDFDWAGTAGTVKYPICLSTAEDWHENAGVSCPIEHAHDQHMVKILCS